MNALTMHTATIRARLGSALRSAAVVVGLLAAAAVTPTPARAQWVTT